MRYENNRAEDVKIAYIGGGSRGWAWGLMSDLAAVDDMNGTVALYDIDREAAEKNAVIGNRMKELPDCRSAWKYAAADSLKELVPKGYNKATGMQVICADLGVDKNDTYAFGDSGNDMDMLSYAGVGIAMGNAAREVREKADYITAGIREHGIYLGLKEFGLI